MNKTDIKKTQPRMSWLGWLGIGILTLIICGAVFIYLLVFHNYAQDALVPIESALTKEGATKACGRGDNGLGPDNRTPRAVVVYQVPGNQQQATDTVRHAASAAGYSLTEYNPDVYNPEGRKFYEDKTSEKSTYWGLKPGNVELSVEVYGSSFPTGDGSCGVQSSPNAPDYKTRVQIQISLPSF